MTEGQKYLRRLQLAFFKGHRPDALPKVTDQHRKYPNYERIIQMLEQAQNERITPEQVDSEAVHLSMLQSEIIKSCRQREIDFGLDLPLLGTVASQKIDASIVRVPGSDEILIVLDRGLFDFMNEATNSLFCSIGVDKDKSLTELLMADTNRPITVPQDENPWLAVTISYFESYVVNGITTSIKVDEGYLPQPGEFFLMTSIISLFIVGHEWGHLIGGHLHPENVKPSTFGDVAVEIIEKSYDDETFADYCGVAFCADFLERDQLPLEWMAMIDLFFWYIDMIERSISILLRGIDDSMPSSTHPSACSRARIVSYWIENAWEPAMISRYQQFRERLLDIAVVHIGHTIARMWQLRH